MNRDEEAHMYHDELEEDHKNHEEGWSDDTAHVHDKIHDVCRVCEEPCIHHEALHDEAPDEALVKDLYILFHFQRI